MRKRERRIDRLQTDAQTDWTDRHAAHKTNRRVYGKDRHARQTRHGIHGQTGKTDRHAHRTQRHTDRQTERHQYETHIQYIHKS